MINVKTLNLKGTTLALRLGVFPFNASKTRCYIFPLSLNSRNKFSNLDIFIIIAAKNMRINQFLAQTGLGSRRKVEELIRQKKVTLNNQVAVLTDQVDPQVDEIKVNQQIVKVQTKILYAFNKPKGIVCSLSSQNQEKTIMDYLPPGLPRLFPVGRLDKNSSGLLLLTNDGDLALKLSHPSYSHEKEYEVWVHGNSLSSRFSHLSLLTHLDSVKLAPFKITNIYIQGSQAKFNLTLTQGLNHQIRRMADKVGLSVKEIKRIRIGQFKLNDLQSGEMKQINY